MPEWYEKYKNRETPSTDGLSMSDLSSQSTWKDVIADAAKFTTQPQTENWYEKYKKQEGKSENYRNYLAAWEAEKKIIDTKDWRFSKQFYNKALAQPLHEVVTQAPSTLVKSMINLKEFAEEIAKDKPDYNKLHKNLHEDASANVLAADVPNIEALPKDERLIATAKDITAGVAGFVAQLALLKKAFPGTNPAHLWELQNVASGGQFGKGYLDYAVFNLPGKFIKGTSKLAQLGKVAAESSTFAGYNAIEQKLTTGEIDPVEVGVAAGIPVGLKGFGSLVTAGVKLKSPRITTAIVKATPKKYKAQINSIINPDIQKVKAVRVERKMLSKGKTKLRRSLPEPQKRLPMTAEEAINRKAGEVYDDLLKQYESGNKKAGQKLSKLVQGQNLPTINELYERVGNGDKVAAEAIQQGLYSSSPESVVLGLREEAAKLLKIPKDKVENLILKERIGYKSPGIPVPDVTKGAAKPTKPSTGIYDVEYFKDGKIKSAVPIPNAKTIEDAPLQKEVNAVTDELRTWIKGAKKYRTKVVEKAKAKLRRRQAGRGTNILEKELEASEGNAWEAIGKSKAGYKGKMGYKEIDPPNLTDNQWNSLAKKILEVYPKGDPSVQFQRTNTLKAFDKLRRGLVPTNREFELISPIIGEDAAQEIWMGIQKGRPFSWWEIPKLGVAMFKTKFGLDNQTARQASSVKYKHPALYIDAVKKNEFARWSNNYAEKATDALKNSPNYADSAKYINYVGERGFRSGRLEYYGMGFTERLLTAKFKNKFLDKQFGQTIRDYGKLLEANERGASVGINSIMKGMWDLFITDLGKMKNLSQADVIKFKKNRGKTINTFLKILRTKNPQLQELQTAANYVVFSPSMTIGRPLSIKAMLANKGSRAYAGDIIARNIAGNQLTSMMFAGIGNHLRTQNPTQEPIIDGDANPLSGKWGKGKIESVWYDNSGGDAPFYRTLARIGASAYATGRELATGEKTTKLGNAYIPDAGETISNYIETRETAMLGFAKTMLTGKDWMGNPIPRFDTTVRALSPEVIEAMYDAGRADGLWSMLLSGVSAAGSVGTGVYDPFASTMRRKYRDIRANQEYDSDWDDLSPSEQRVLKSEYHSEFTEMDERVRLEREKNPYDYTKTREQELEAGEDVISRLKGDNILKISDVTVQVSRRPKNFYLNDERYNAYISLITKELDTMLDGYNVKEPNKKVVERFVESAKKIAYSKLLSAVEAKQL